MKKIKRFKLAQSQYLSSDEMSKIDGGFDLEDCTASNVGAHCIYTNGNSKATGICKYVYRHESDGTTSSTFSGYVCVKD
jgi:hypothetical protein